MSSNPLYYVTLFNTNIYIHMHNQDYLEGVPGSPADSQQIDHAQFDYSQPCRLSGAVSR